MWPFKQNQLPGLENGGLSYAPPSPPVRPISGNAPNIPPPYTGPDVMLSNSFSDTADNSGVAGSQTIPQRISQPTSGLARKLVALVNSNKVRIQSWFDFALIKPSDPRTLIANAYIGSTAGNFKRSSTFAVPSGSWVSSPFVFNGSAICTALGTDNQQMIADAAQWNIQHGTVNTSSALAIPLRKIIFLRAGRQWQMEIPLNLGGSTYTDLELSFRNNAATSGNYTGSSTGTIPVISFTGSFTGVVTLKLTLRYSTEKVLAIRAITNTGTYSMFEMECMIVH